MLNRSLSVTAREILVEGGLNNDMADACQWGIHESAEEGFESQPDTVPSSQVPRINTETILSYVQNKIPIIK